MRYIFLFLFALSSYANTVEDAESWRAVRPKSGPTVSFPLPTFETAVLPNGLKLIVSKQSQLPIVVARVVILAGSSAESAKQAGLANLTFDMLQEGAGDLDALQFADAISEIGTSLSVGVLADAGILSLSVMKKNLNRALDLMSLAVQKPRFAQTDFDRVKQQALTGLKGQAGIPGAIAMRAFWQQAYGKEHPYGHTATGSITSVTSISLQDVKNFWQERLGANQAALILTGDITMLEAKELANKYFGTWKKAQLKPPVVVHPPKNKSMRVGLIDRKKAPQALIFLGRPWSSAKNKHEAVDDVFNEILGGMFSSRLNQNLREEKAWTYGVSSAISSMRGAGPFLVHTNIQVPHGTDAFNQMMIEFEKIKKYGVTQKELVAAKDNLIKSYSGKFETINAIASQATQIFMYDLPPAYFSTWMKNVSQVTRKQVQQAARRILDKKHLTAVVVGDLDTIKIPGAIKLELDANT